MQASYNSVILMPNQAHQIFLTFNSDIQRATLSHTFPKFSSGIQTTRGQTSLSKARQKVTPQAPITTKKSNFFPPPSTWMLVYTSKWPIIPFPLKILSGPRNKSALHTFKSNIAIILAQLSVSCSVLSTGSNTYTREASSIEI